MTVEQESSLDSIQTAIDGGESPPAGEVSARAGVRGLIRQWTHRCLARWRPVLATAFVLAAMGLAVSLFFLQYRPDRQIDDAAAQQAIQAASEGAVALLSYSYDNLDRDFAAARSHLTGDFLTYYDKFSRQGVAPAAQEGQLTTTATVIRAAVVKLDPDSAVVLVFLNQRTASKKAPEKAPQSLKTVSSVLVTLTKVEGSWLIEKFDPQS